jgi:hypothetical protein
MRFGKAGAHPMNSTALTAKSDDAAKPDIPGAIAKSACARRHPPQGF